MTHGQLFFDDELRNKEVETLGKRSVTFLFASGIDYLNPQGVTFCLVPDGVNDKAFEEGLREWRKSNPE